MGVTYPLSPAGRTLLILSILAVLAWYAYGRTHKPSPATVNGTYRSSCCGDVVLRDGWFITDQGRTHFDLENMKFGLTAYPERPIRVDGRHVVRGPPSTDAEGVIFSEDTRVFTLCSTSPRCEPEYKFARN